MRYDDSAEIEFLSFHSQRAACTVVFYFASGVCHFCKYMNKHIIKDRFIYPYTFTGEWFGDIPRYSGFALGLFLIFLQFRRRVVWRHTLVKYICIG